LVLRSWFGGRFGPKGAVIALAGGPGGGDLVFDLGAGGQAEVRGLLACGVGLVEFFEQLAGEDLAFDAYGGEGHWNAECRLPIAE